MEVIQKDKESNSRVKICLENDNELSVEYLGDEEEVEYAYYIYHNDKIIRRIWYTNINSCVWRLEDEGTYKVEVYVKFTEDLKISYFSDEIVFTKKAAKEEKPARKSIFRIVQSITREILGNWSMMWNIAKYDYKLQNKDSMLGKLWGILTPLIQIGTYWLVFGLGLRQGKDMDGYPYLLWMLCGLIPWFFISSSITKGAGSIFSKVSTITKLKYPISTVPTGVILTNAIEFGISMIILEIVLLAYGYFPTLNYINIIYYGIYMFAFLVSLSLVTSVLTMVARDFQKLLVSLTRLLFYLTPVLWDMSSMPLIYQNIVGNTPFFYIIRGFRDSILYQVPFYEHTLDIAIAWSYVLILYIWGCCLQDKFRNKFRDLI